jgi:hypothetical protein
MRRLLLSEVSETARATSRRLRQSARLGHRITKSRGENECSGVALAGRQSLWRIEWSDRALNLRGFNRGALFPA